MRSHTTIAMAGLIFILCAACSSEEFMTHSISLTSAKEVSLGEPIALHVVFANENAAPWKLTNPEVGMGVVLHYQMKGRPDTSQGESLGKVTVTTRKDANGQIIEARVAPAQPEIEIVKGTPHEFDLALFSQWADWKVGVYEIWLQDVEQKVSSNKIEVKVELTEKSIPLLLSLAADDAKPAWQRKQAVSWLKKISPDFQFSVPAADAPAREVERIKAENTRAADKFKAYWDSLGDKKTLLSKIE